MSGGARAGIAALASSVVLCLLLVLQRQPVLRDALLHAPTPTEFVMHVVDGEISYS
jgi:hypothetical protein